MIGGGRAPSGRSRPRPRPGCAPLPEAVRAALGSAADGVWAETDYIAAIEAAEFVDVRIELIPIEPAPGTEKIERSAPTGGARARVVMRIGETGETRVVDLDELPAEGTLARSFSGRIKARKPGRPAAGLPA